MSRLTVFIGGVACFALGVAVQAMLEIEDVADFLRSNLQWITISVLVGLALLGLGLWFVTAMLRRKAQSYLNLDDSLTDEQLVQNIVDHFTSTQNLSVHARASTIVGVGTWLMRREAKQFYFNVIVAVMGGLIGTATLFLLYEQNRKIALQTDANIAESILVEGNRRASLAGETFELISELRKAADPDKARCGEQVNFDCWHNEDNSQFAIFRLAPDLHERVRSFAERNPPYRIALAQTADLDFEVPLREQYNFYNTSPERGRVLLQMVDSRIEVSGIAFSAAQLAEAQLVGANLSTAILNTADLGESNLSNANLQSADLRGTFFTGANLYDANLSYSTVFNATFRHADLIGTNFERADLFNVDFQNARMLDANLSSTHISKANFTSAFLTGVDWSGSWAWRDWPPIGIPFAAPVQFCEYDDELHVRENRPRDCDSDQ